MMICPACNCELLLHNDYCENCGAPAYLATASQPAEVTHCTYCGARDEQGTDRCTTCGLKKNFKTSESVIGTCRNCGVAWRNVWMYCQTCGVARANGLVDTSPPVTISFQPLLGQPLIGQPLLGQPLIGRAAAANYGFNSVQVSSYRPSLEWSTSESESDAAEMFSVPPEFNDIDESEMQSFLSENEVVGRMYVNPDDAHGTTGQSDLRDFFSESEIADHRRATSLGKVEAAQKAAQQVVYDLPAIKNEAPASQSQPQIIKPLPTDERSQNVAAPIEAKTTITPEIKPQVITREEVRPELTTPIVMAPPMQSHPANVQTTNTDVVTTAETKHPEAAQPESSVISATAAAKSATKSSAGAVQTVRFLNRPRTHSAPPIDKKLIKMIAVLISLILVFSALIVSGFRIRDLFSKPQPQVISQPTPAPSAQPSQPDQIPKAPEGMVYIPGGSFRMGRDDGDTYESPSHPVTVAAFFMDRTEVTNAQYAEFLKATNHLSPPEWKNGQYPAGTGKFPVINVSWQDANDYASWSNKRLPTEAEWEYAAKGQDSRRYPWGSNWDESKANTAENQRNRPTEVGSYENAANPFGLLDMAGNVWEWVNSDVVSYKEAGITLAPGKVIRGGAYYLPKERATTTYRGFASPDKVSERIGFRCVKDISL